MTEIEKEVEMLARKAGEYAKEKNDTLVVSSKGGDPRDVVTNVDIEITDLLRQEIRSLHPDHAFYSEEAPEAIDEGVPTWIIDPIDGTSNYARSIPYYSSCVTLMHEGKVIASAVYAPTINECFQLTTDGVLLNGDLVSVGQVETLKEAYVNFHPGRKSEFREWAGEVKKELLAKARKSINLASSALDLCYVASGRIDILVYGTFSTIDIAGTIEMVRRAGGEIYNYDTREPVGYSTEPQRIIATANRQLLESFFENITV